METYKYVGGYSSSWKDVIISGIKVSEVENVYTRFDEVSSINKDDTNGYFFLCFFKFLLLLTNPYSYESQS